MQKVKTYKMPNLGKFIRVESIQSDKGYDVANQYIIKFEKGEIFQSYNSIIVVWTGSQMYIGQDYDYSRTTGKYRNQYLQEDLAETRKSIKNGEYKMLNI